MKNEDTAFLKGDDFCDIHHPEIKKLSENITKNCWNDREKAIALFYWVRDKILYRVGLWNKKASETLLEGEGSCTNKANLLVALLRAAGIPSGFGVMKVYGKQYFGPAAIPMFRKYIGDVSTHIYTMVYLDEWIAVDPSDDRMLCENTHHFNHTTKIVDWDGRNCARLNIRDEDIINDIAPLKDIDSWMKKKPKNATGLRLKLANTFVHFARRNTVRVESDKELEKIYKNYLKSHYPHYFFLYEVKCLYDDLELINRWKRYLRTPGY